MQPEIEKCVIYKSIRMVFKTVYNHITPQVDAQVKVFIKKLTVSLN